MPPRQSPRPKKLPPGTIAVTGAAIEANGNLKLTLSNGDTLDCGNVVGRSAFVWIKYADQEPTSNGDMKDTPGDWIGVYGGDSATPPASYTSYKWFRFKGEHGRNNFIHIRYASQNPANDSDMTETPSAWMGVYYGESVSAPGTYTSYAWQKVRGSDGDGGNMWTGVYDQNEDGIVDRADSAAMLGEIAPEDFKPPAFAPFGLAAGQVAEGNKVIGRVASPVAGTVPTVGADGQLAGSSVPLASLLRTGQAEVPNLYINAAFNIFQRGNSVSVSGRKYSADRWIMSGNTRFTATRHNMGLMMTATNSNTYMGVQQLIEMTPSMASRLLNKELCVRYLLHPSAACKSMVGNTINAGTTGECKLTRVFTMDDYNNVVANGYYSSPSIGVYALADGSALPVGFFAILTYAQITVGDPGGFVTPARYADDLLACQRYYQKRAVLAVPSPYGPTTVWYYRAGSCIWTPMRTTPVMSVTGLDITSVGSIPLANYSATLDIDGNLTATITGRTAAPSAGNVLLLYGAEFDAEIY